jgi:hypothetical protein
MQNNEKILNIDKEIEFINGIKYLRNKYGEELFYNLYWRPQFYKNGFPIIKRPKNEIEKDFILISEKIKKPSEHTNEEKEKYEKKIDEIIKITNFVFTAGINKKTLKIQRAAIHRYYVISGLNFISVSLSPEIKKKMKINFELFGSFYNTNVNYCGLFSDIENSSCDFNTFKLIPNMIILINPPFTKTWIIKSCKIIENIMKKNLNTIIYLIIPVWNNSDRKKLGLKIYKDLGDIPEIDNLKLSKYLVYHKIDNLDFYDGVTKKKVKLKDNVHLFKFNSNL